MSHALEGLTLDSSMWEREAGGASFNNNDNNNSNSNNRKRAFNLSSSSSARTDLYTKLLATGLSQPGLGIGSVPRPLSVTTVARFLAPAMFDHVSPAQCVCLPAGGTHVSVGFTDLNVLLTAPLVAINQHNSASSSLYSNSPTSGKSSGTRSQTAPENPLAPEPLVFIGLSFSAYNVAKSRVILQMLRQGGPYSSCVQVIASFIATCFRC